MYLSSDTPLFAQDRARRQCKDARSDACIQRMKDLSRAGRFNSFETLISPQQVGNRFGAGAGVDTAHLQRLTRTSRALGLLSQATFSSGSGDNGAQTVQNAPTVLPMNQAGSCRDWITPPNHMGKLVPTMPPEAPRAYTGWQDRGEAPIPAGLSGWSPSWADAWQSPVPGQGPAPPTGVWGWISEHPWLSLGLAGAGVVAISKRSGR